MANSVSLIASKRGEAPSEIGCPQIEDMSDAIDGLERHYRGDFLNADFGEVEAADRESEACSISNSSKTKFAKRCPMIIAKDPTEVAHIDLDVNDPIKFVQLILLDCFVPSGYLINDDAAASPYPGAIRAVRELVRDYDTNSDKYFRTLFLPESVIADG